MTTTPQTWTGKAAHALAQWGNNRWALFLLIWTLNSLVRPYAGFVHDARLYAVQVLNQVEPGSFADDLFLRYGSQDQFSAFSRLVAPLVGWLGIESTFFLLYLVFNWLFIYALVRFVEAAIPDRRIGALASIYLAVTPLPFGGMSIFHVHEPFTTPRILANALTLLALEQVLAARFAPAAILLLAGGLMHPLMAAGGGLIWLGCLLVTRLPPKIWATLLALAGVAGITVLAYPPWGYMLFGAMDDGWRDMVLAASAYNFPAEWPAADWMRTVVSLAVVATAAWTQRGENHRLARFLGVVVVAGIAGLAATILASLLPYALLFQAQPYRVLWIVKALEAPLGFWLAARWLNEPGRAALGALLLGYLGLTSFLPLEIAFPFVCWLFFMLAYRGLDALPRRQDWLRASALSGVVCGFLGWTIYKWCIVGLHWESFLTHVDTLDMARMLVAQLGPVGFTLITLAALVRWGAIPRRWWAAPLVILGVNVLFFLGPLSASYRALCTRDGADMDFVRTFLGQHTQPEQTPTVYCALGRADYVWINLRAKSYYDWAQIVGILFNRQTAVEGSRRAIIVSPFEVDRLRNDPFCTDEGRRLVEMLYQTSMDSPPPSRDDLARLCREEVDFAVLKQEFSGLAVAGNGRLFIYDCRRLRAQFGDPPWNEPSAALALRTPQEHRPYPSSTKETAP